MIAAWDIDVRLATLRSALHGLADVFGAAKDLHLVDPSGVEALLNILGDEMERTEEEVLAELRRLRTANPVAA